LADNNDSYMGTEAFSEDKSNTKKPDIRDKSLANERQVGGKHYKNAIQHWDWAASNNLDYFQGCITKYVARWKDKNGVEDLLKAQHYLEKYLEEIAKGNYGPNPK